MNLNEKELELYQALDKVSPPDLHPNDILWMNLCRKLKDELNSGPKIHELQLSVRARNALHFADITQISQLIRMSDGDLIKIRNLGRTTITNIRDAVKKYLEAHPTQP